MWLKVCDISLLKHKGMKAVTGLCFQADNAKNT